MISDKIIVSDQENACEGLETALDTVEKTAAFVGFPEAEAKRLRVVAEELVAGSASMLDVFSGTLWAQTEAERFQIVLEMEGTFTQDERERLISLTKDHKNTMPEGFFAKLGVLISDAMTGEYFYPYDLDGSQNNAELMWDAMELNDMMREMRKPDAEDQAIGEKAKETLEALADDVTVSASGGHVLITVSKALPK